MLPKVDKCCRVAALNSNLDPDREEAKQLCCLDASSVSIIFSRQ